ncbi:MAG: S8 family serine peptidase [Planctomycetaceae bacterium]|nr:S8 family serine peptidase [Planctomycetaceae bacterium]
MIQLIPLRKLSFALLLGGFLSLFMNPALKAAPPEKVKVFIAFEEPPGLVDIAKVEAAGGRVKWAYKTVPVLSAEVPKAALPGLLRNPGVAFVEPDLQVSINDLELDNSWGVKKIGSEPSHLAGDKGTGVKVGVIDSGIDYNHPDLAERYAGGYDFFNNDNDPMDDRGHGSHVAGTIGASDNGFGVVGVAPEVQLYALKVFGATGSGYFSDVIAAVEWCMENNIQVTNNSYGASGHPGATVQAVFDNAASLGMLHCASAGNSGSGTDTVGYPAKFSSVIAVAATTSSDTRASFSSTGPDVELAAPGTSITSTLPGGGYGGKSGTSMASPHVAGAAALLLGIGVTDSNGDGLVNDDIRELLTLSALDLGTTGFDNNYGFGRVDVEMAVFLNGEPPPPEEEPVAEEPVAEEPPPPPEEELPLEMYVSSIQYAGYGGKNRDKHFDVAVQILDEFSAPVPGATVSVTVSTTGTSEFFTGTTDDAGTVVFSVKNAKKGTWTTTVDSVSAPGYDWIAGTPSNTYVK